jgi:integrase
MSRNVIKVRECKFLEQGQVRAILQTAHAASPRDGLMLELAYLYGLRVSELVRLKRQDYRKESGRIWIERSKGSLTGEAPLFKNLAPKLDAYLAGRRDQCPTLFVGRQGAMSTRQVQLLFDRHAAAAGVALRDGQGVHCLRHSIACHLIADGWTVPKVQKHLAHASIKSTQWYVDIMDEDRRKDVEALATSSRVVIL